MMPSITSRKPTLWTLHDPWALTGHCIQPGDCEKWICGCKSCPDLGRHFKLRRDNAALLWELKQSAYQRSEFEIHVLSEWMEGMVSRSPLFKRKRIHRVKMGVDLDKFAPKNDRDTRAKIGIGKEDFVIMLRENGDPLKGLEFAVKALNKIKLNRPISVISVDKKGLMGQLDRRIHLFELGELNESNMIMAYQSSDVFLMPSRAESFGMMAVEAMACGVPVIVTKGSALTEITANGKAGLAVDYGDVESLTSAIEMYGENRDFRENLSDQSRELALKEYDARRYATEMLALYEGVIKRYHSRSSSIG